MRPIRAPDSATRESPPRVSLTFDAVFPAELPFVVATLRRLRVHPHDRDDLCQEVLLAVHSCLASFDGNGALRGWLYGICVNVSRRHRRRPYSRREVLTSLLPDAHVAAEQYDHLARKQSVVALRHAIHDLPDLKRKALCMHDIDEMPMHQVADLLKCPMHTAFSRVYAARRELKEAVQRRHPHKTDA